MASLRMAAPAAVLILLTAAVAPHPSAAASPAPAAPAASAAASAPSQPAYDGAAQDAGTPAAPSAAVQDKFLKLQREMSRGGKPSAAAGSADPSRVSAEPAPESVGILTFSLKLLFGTAFVLVLAVFSIRLLKRLQGRMLSRPSTDGAGGDLFEVMETCHLGAQQRVVALRIMDEVGILGVTPQGISLLTVLKQPADEVRRARIGSGNPAAFSDNLNRILDRFKKPKRVGDLLNESKIG